MNKIGRKRKEGRGNVEKMENKRWKIGYGEWEGRGMCKVNLSWVYRVETEHMWKLSFDREDGRKGEDIER